MSLENWVVRNQNGETLGVIGKVVLDPRTSRILYTEMTLSGTDAVVRVPWRDLEMGPHGLVLDGTVDDIAVFYYVPVGDAPCRVDAEQVSAGDQRVDKCLPSLAWRRDGKDVLDTPGEHGRREGFADEPGVLENRIPREDVPADMT